jgi:hypothetical protein
MDFVFAMLRVDTPRDAEVVGGRVEFAREQAVKRQGDGTTHSHSHRKSRKSTQRYDYRY